jgi:hypothetical protein
MPTQGSGRGRGRKGERPRSPGANRKRTLDRTVTVALLRERDILAMGGRDEVIEYMEDKYGQIEPGQEEPIDLPAGEIPSCASEVPLTDEDEDREPLPATQACSEDKSADETDWRIDDHGRVNIVVVNGRAVFQIPDWASGYADGTLALRWHTYSSIANWLNDERGDFLREPSFMNLTGHDIDFAKPVPVLQEGLHQILGLPCDKTTFSKHARLCVIRWPCLGSRQFPLDGIWSREARLSWMAQGARQRQEARGYAPKSSPLGDPTIQPPRASAERHRLRSRAPHAMRMGPVEFAQLLCVLAGCTWRDVLDRHSDHIFFEG